MTQKTKHDNQILNQKKKNRQKRWTDYFQQRTRSSTSDAVVRTWILSQPCGFSVPPEKQVNHTQLEPLMAESCWWESSPRRVRTAASRPNLSHPANRCTAARAEWLNPGLQHNNIYTYIHINNIRHRICVYLGSWNENTNRKMFRLCNKNRSRKEVLFIVRMTPSAFYHEQRQRDREDEHLQFRVSFFISKIYSF